VADCELGHVVPFFPQRDEVVVYPRLVLARVVEVELFGLHIIFAQLFLLEFGNLFQKALFFFNRESPSHDYTVLE